MKYQIGNVTLDSITQQSIIYPNKTRKYLLPCLREYGDEFVSRLNNVYKVAVGLGDMVITRRYFKAPERHLFILLHTQIAPNFFISFLDWIKEQPMYEDDYVYGNIQKSIFHMVVIKFPAKFWDSFETFNSGKYSEMFDKDTIDTYFVGKDNPNAPKVLVKDHNYRIIFTRKLNKMFELNGKDAINSEEYLGELDFPPKEQEETFN